MFEIVIICTIKYNLFYVQNKPVCRKHGISSPPSLLLLLLCWLDVVSLRWLSWAFQVQFDSSTVCKMWLA